MFEPYIYHADCHTNAGSVKVEICTLAYINLHSNSKKQEHIIILLEPAPLNVNMKCKNAAHENFKGAKVFLGCKIAPKRVRLV